MRRPVNSPYTITTEFGVKDSYALFGYHSGVDYAVPSGRAIYAPTKGVVSNIVSNTGGNMVVIYDGQFYHRLMHNSRFSVPNGAHVYEGQKVAEAGTTGLSTGPHCHWDINRRGNTAKAFSDFISPADWLAGKYEIKGGSEVANSTQVKNIYKAVMHRAADASGLKHYTGQDANFIIADFLKSAEFKNHEQSMADMKKQVASLKTALANEKNKKPETVIKEVEKIVEKIVEVEKPVDEKLVVTNWLKRVWDSLFKK